MQSRASSGWVAGVDLFYVRADSVPNSIHGWNHALYLATSNQGTTATRAEEPEPEPDQLAVEKRNQDMDKEADSGVLE
ncbi:hypothetical protein FQN53_007547, partial [Emmonsiellopsis sp. PD_33]